MNDVILSFGHNDDDLRVAGTFPSVNAAKREATASPHFMGSTVAVIHDQQTGRKLFVGARERTKNTSRVRAFWKNVG